MSKAPPCYICGDIRDHMRQEHHVVPRRLNGADSEENVVLLCAGCHYAIEKLYDHSFYERLSARLHLGVSINKRGRDVREGIWGEDEVIEVSKIRDEVEDEYDFRELDLGEKIKFIYRNRAEVDDEEKLHRKLERIYANSIAEEEQTIWYQIMDRIDE